MKIIMILLILANTAYSKSAEINSNLWREISVDITDYAAMQRGAVLFFNKCSGCHNLEHERYDKLAKGIGIVDNGDLMTDVVKSGLIKTGDKLTDVIMNSADPALFSKWFGIVPPDLTNIIRVRGANWVYNYLRGFYNDPSKQWGVNNIVFDGVGMPNILEDLSGTYKPVYGDNGKLVDISKIKEGLLSTNEFDLSMQDLVTFLTYVSEPIAVERTRIGVFVIFSLLVLSIFTWLVKREYWKDLH